MSSIHVDGLPEFVQLDDKYNCLQCKKVLQGAMQTACGHRVCERHIDEAIQEGKIYYCPGGEPDCLEIDSVNRQVTVNPDFCARTEISKLPVYCTFHENGCSDTVPWRNLKKHLEECLYIIMDCPNQENGCQEKLLKKDLKDHVEQNCKFRKEACPYCQEEFIIAIIQNHMTNECPQVPITCPYGCASAAFPRGDISSHEAECPVAPKQCRYSALGCTFKGNKDELETHHTEFNTHLGTFAVYSAEYALKTSQLVNQFENLKSENDKQKYELEEFKKENETLKKSLESTQTRLKSMQVMLVKHGETVIRLDEDVKKGGVADPQSIKASLLSETKSLEERIQQLEVGTSYGGTSTGSSENLDGIKSQLRQLDRLVGYHDLRLAEQDLRLDVNDCICYEGYMLWKITNYAKRKQDAINGKTLSLYSPPFYTSRYGYKMCGRVYLNGDGIGKGTHVSIFFVLMKGEYDSLLEFPFRQKITLQMMDQSSDRRHLQDAFRPDPTSSSFKLPVKDMNIASGCPLFVRQETLEQGGYLKDDCIIIKVAADLNDPPLVPI
ncbi:unnamed protein product [Owenia fusiformis]|uniref:TNF receptor-associated factor 3 n=1 Tax=Owenia fusiformis TaxID=6347 RepID=A0A8S4PDQ1_OWEFU|nr:unnamed protein product [Owenia fusiformis]